MEPEPITITTPTIKLAAFLKYTGVVPTGGQARLALAGGDVEVNGQPETRRGRTLHHGDMVRVGDLLFQVEVKPKG